MKKYWLGLIMSALLLFQASALIGVQAQEPAITDGVRAEVRVYELNLRNFPSRTNTEVLAILPMGTVLRVHHWEDAITLRRIWVYVNVEETGLSGWVDSNYLNFSRDDWQSVLPVLDSREALNEFAEPVFEALPHPLTAMVTVWHYRLNVRDVPSLTGSNVIGKLYKGEGIEVLRNALIDGEYSPFVYVRHPLSGLEGWVHSRYITGQAGWQNWVNSNLETVVYDNEPNTISTTDSNSMDIVLRSEPNPDSGIVGSFTAETPFILLGGTGNRRDTWVYVQLLNGQRGWMPDRGNFVTARGNDGLDLRWLEGVAHPDIHPDRANFIAELTVTTILEPYLNSRVSRIESWYWLYWRTSSYPSAPFLPIDTNVQAIGRDHSGNWLRIQHEGQLYWITAASTNINSQQKFQLPVYFYN